MGQVRSALLALLFLLPQASHAAVSATNVKASVAGATLSSVSSSATSVSLLASNVRREGVILFNDSSQVVYVAFAASATTSAYTHKMAAGSFWQMEYPIYTGAISAIWASANGSMKITELTP